MRILNLGSLNIDYVYRVDHFVAPGETKSSQSLLINAGGKGLNQSIAAAKAGNAVLHAGLLGRDGQMLKQQLTVNGVDVSLLEDSDQVSGHAIIEVDASGQNRILLYGGTNQLLTEEQVDRTLDAFGSEGVVLLQNETNLVGYIMEQAKKRGLKIAFNAAPMNEKVFTYPLELVDYLIVNEVEGAGIVHQETYEAIFEALCKRFPACTILLTLGRSGAVCRHDDECASIAACTVKAVDTTAAGDSFTGYFLYGMLNDLPLKATLRLATCASALAVTRNGAAESVPTMDEVQEAIRTGSIQAPEAKDL